MGVIGGGISINGPSGIDTANLVEQLTALEQERVTTIENEKDKYQVKIDAYSNLRSLLSTLASKAGNLKTASDFDIFKSVSSNEDIVTLKGDIGAIESTYDISVFQLARNEKMISKGNLITSQTVSLSSLGINVGDISIDGTKITIDSDDTVQDVRMKINNATDEDGNKLNVSASVLKVSDADFRLVLTAKNTGSKGVDYQDVSGQTLFKLGIITGNGAGNKGTIAQVLKSQDTIQSAFAALGAGASIQFSGTDRDGNNVQYTYIKPAADTSIDDFFAKVENNFHNMVDASVDTDGKLVITDKVQGSSQLTLNSLSMSGTAYAVNVAVVGEDGPGVLSVGKDAYFNVDGLALTSTDNNADGQITGVTIQLHKTSVSETVQTNITRDVDAVQKKVQELLDAYNALLTFVSENTKMADPGDKDSKDGDLANDMTAKNIVDQVRNQMKLSMNFFGGSYNSLTMFGVKSDSATGEMSLEEDQFTKAMTNNFDEAVRFFVTTGVSDNKNISLGRFTKDTRSGNYTLKQVNADYLQIQFGSDATWYTSDARVGDIVTFSTGSAKGLSITAAAGVIGSGSAMFTFSKGLGDRLSELVDNMSDPENGMITIRQNSLTSSIDSANERMDAMQKRVNDYHDRLVKQFAAMEEALLTMQNQQANMLSALGWTSSS